jgi:hypothetical protein
MMICTPRRFTFVAVALAMALMGCASGMKTTQFTNPGFDFAFVEKVAVLPLENLSTDRQAGQRATRLLITELLAAGAVDVVEPGEVQTALDRIPGGGRSLSKEQVIGLGQTLDVQALILGSVTQSELIRSGTLSIPTVTLDLHMLETETGTSVWAATHTEKGSGLSAKLLGTGAEPISTTTRRCVQQILETLVQ